MVVTTEKINEISSGQNAVIFVLDTYDTKFIEEIYEKEPEYLDQLEGFTWFRNSNSMYSATQYSLPYILTGEKYYNDQMFLDYVENAYKRADYLEDLKANNYDVCFYTYSNFVSSELADGTITNVIADKAVISSYIEMTQKLYRLVLYSYVPHVLKPSLWFYDNEMFSGLKKVAPSTDAEKPMAHEQYSDDNFSFLRVLQDEGLKVEEGENVYKVIHLKGTHHPRTIDADMNYIEAGTASDLDAAKGVLRIVYTYIDQLKEAGVYDNTLLVVMSDHGDGDPSEENGWHSHAGFLVKPVGAQEKFSISDVPVSHADIIPTVMSGLSLNGDNRYGSSIFDIEEDSSRIRDFMYCEVGWNVWDEAYAPPFLEYQINADGQMELTENIYTRDGLLDYDAYMKWRYLYDLGTVIIYKNCEEKNRRTLSAG